MYYAGLPVVGNIPFVMLSPALYTSLALGHAFIIFGITNSLGRIVRQQWRNNIDHPLEYFMPQVEIDKVARTYMYLAGKGRRIVREVQEGR